MAVIKPFKGIRPPQKLVSKVAGPPYDVVNSDEARQIAAGNPHSFLHINRSEIDLDPKIDIHAPEVYQKAGENFKKFLKEGTLVADTKDSFYVYRLEMDGRSQIGVVAGIFAEQYDQGLVKRHELTRPEKEEDRVKHTLAINANAGPVFLAYRKVKKIDDLIKKLTKGEPEYDFISKDPLTGVEVRHILWVVNNDKDVKAIQDAFAKVPCLYIADGHHRASVANIIAKQKKAANPKHTGEENYNYFLAVMFPDEQLRVMDYNRVLKDLNGLSDADFLAKVGEKFTIEKSDNKKPDSIRTFKMYFRGAWHKLTAKAGTYEEQDPVKSLDVAILQDNLLGPILGIDDPRKSKRIDFVGGIRGMAELEKRCKNDCVAAFALYPMSMEQLLKIADAGQLVPPKSTWFEPKLKSGLVVKSLD